MTNSNVRMDALLESQKQILEMIRSGQNLHEILDALLRVVEGRAPGTIGTILLYDSKEKKLLHGGGPSMPKHYNDAIHGVVVGPNVGSCGTAAYTGAPCIIEDINTHPNWAPYLELTRPIGLAACWSTPFLSFDKKVLGTFAMYYREKKKPTLFDRKLIDFTTHLATIAVERDRERQAKAG